MKHTHTWKYQLANDELATHWCEECGAIKTIYKKTTKTYNHLIPKIAKDQSGGKVSVEKPGYGFLGWANGWQDIPKIITLCKQQSHKTEEISIGHCIHLKLCETCGYWYKYDSSG